MRRLIVLMQALPHSARSLQDDPDDVPWGMVEELLAQLVDLSAIRAAERRIPEPYTVPRPGRFDDTPVESHPRTPAGGGPVAQPRPPKRGRGDTTPVAGTTVGLGAATVEMAAWAARNGGAGGNGAKALGFGGDG